MSRGGLTHAGLAMAAACLQAWCTVAGAATPVYKCLVQGTVTYQAEPCRTGPAAPRPTLEQLNAARKRQIEAADAQRVDAAAAAPSSAAGVTPGPSSSPSARAAGRAGAATPAQAAAPVAAPVAAPPAPAYRCDGRRFCSQMTSCDEARYFLAHCPGVSMDGDRNGIPCERQWCGRR